MKTHCTQLNETVTRGWESIYKRVGGVWADGYDGKQVCNAGPGRERSREGRLETVGSDPTVTGA